MRLCRPRRPLAAVLSHLLSFNDAEVFEKLLAVVADQDEAVSLAEWRRIREDAIANVEIVLEMYYDYDVISF
jgi:hypothetical protein